MTRNPLTVNIVAGDVHGTVVQAGSIHGGIHVHNGHSRPATIASTLAERAPWLARVGDAAGVLLDATHVLTYAPVPDSGVQVIFPHTGARPVLATTVHRLSQVPVSILRLAEPVRCTPAPLAAPRSVLDHELWIDGTQAGTPVFDRTADAVVGVLAPGDQPRMLPMSVVVDRLPWLRERLGWRLDFDPSLKTHWLPRARGSEVESDSGASYFTGRVAARQAVCDWLAGTDTLLVVTVGYGPGSWTPDSLSANWNCPGVAELSRLARKERWWLRSTTT